ncbi:MAG: GntR family transcriptional regulator [Burkholderiaceae bacterium]|nr:GntR family transcriptional regulator [Pseudomonadota bacterium]MBS0597858.1 GntR family transcriptional regulator [Pseudomonadota bacterium]MCO5116600.1 GntR family transcriptional regulator [Burkholderiaceae bacterium]MCP5219198.1 GntR family transcriptional regulator [Burkholderiaceae bacterium]
MSKVIASDQAIFARWENAIELRLFADSAGPTLSVPEQVAAKVGNRIVAGTLAPGSRIGEQELADEFKLSRGPVREAIRILEREGLVQVLPRRGAIVTQLSPTELREVFEIRSGLFDIAVRKVTQERPPELLAVMRAGLQRLQTLVDDPSGGDAYAEVTYRLILICTRFSGNERLSRMIAALSLQSLRYSKLGLASLERRRRSLQLWKQATKAMEHWDTEAMMQLARQRSEESAEEAARLLSKSA